MQCTVETAAEGEKGWPVGMKAFSATWATDNAGKNDSNDKENNPGDKNDCDPGFVVRGIQRHHHGWQVRENNTPQKPAAFADFLQAGSVCNWIYKVILFHRPCFIRGRLLFYGGAILLILLQEINGLEVVFDLSNPFCGLDFLYA